MIKGLWIGGYIEIIYLKFNSEGKPNSKKYGKRTTILDVSPCQSLA